MTDEMNKFWDQLRKRASDPQEFTPLTDAEAERRMAEAGEDPMSDREIDQIVHSATAQGPQGVVHRDIEKPQVRYFVKVAAAVLIVVTLVAGVVSTKAILWPEREDHYTAFQSLKYRDAILIVLNAREEEKARNESIARLAVSTRIGIRGLQQSKGNETILRTLRETIQGPAVFEEADLSRVRALKHPIKDSVEFLKDASNPPADRARRGQELGDQLQLGILALKKVQAMEKSDGHLAKSVRVAVKGLTRQLGR